MRKVVVSEFLTVDGVMQGPGGPDEDREGGFQEGGWQLPYFDEAGGAAVAKGLAQTGGLLLGRKTYDIFAAYWPNQPAGDPFADILNKVPKHVASTTLPEPLKWNNSTLIRGDLAAGVAELKRQPGDDLLVIGSGNLVQTLARNDLVDEYRLMIHPLVLGSGKRLFESGGVRVPLKLSASETTGTGVLILTYQRAD
jgi:dihydrofolate reductase